MEEKVKLLLEDCRDAFDWIIDNEYWELIEEYSSAEILRDEIDKILIKKEKQ